MLWASINVVLCSLNTYFFYKESNALNLAVAVLNGLTAIICIINDTPGFSNIIHKGSHDMNGNTFIICR